MSNPSDFVIENGVLKKYVGPGGDVIIPAGVNEVGENAFRDKKFIISISIPESVIKIGKMAFKGCIALESAFLPQGLESIDNRAFMNCSTLKSICIPDSVKSMGTYVFADCGGLEDVTLSKETTRIAQRAFAGCSHLGTIVLPEKVRYIEPSAFKGCTNLSNISLPETLERIDTSAFEQCTELKSVTLPEGLTYIGNYAFCGSGLISIVIPQSVKAIGVRALVSPARVTILGRPKLGQDCIGRAFLATQLPLNEITSPDLKRLAVAGWILSTENDSPVEKAVEKSFRKYWRSRLDVFQHQITTDDRFLPALMEKQLLTLEQTDALLRTFEDHVEAAAMLLSYKHRCFDVKAIEKNEERKIVKAWKGPNAAELRHIWSPKGLPDGTLQLTNYRGTDTEIVVPYRIGSKRVTQIGDFCFSPTVYHRHMKITVTNKETRSKIKSVAIPKVIREIGFHTFGGCQDLQEVILNEGLIYIGEDAFSMCQSLKTIVIPLSVRGIFAGAFAFCSSLKDIYILSKETRLGLEDEKMRRIRRRHPQELTPVFYSSHKLTIHAHADSYAEQYAKEYNIPFEAE